MNAWDLIPVMLLMLLSISLAAGTLVVMLVIHWRKKQTSHSLRNSKVITITPDFTPPVNIYLQRPVSWLAIRSRSLQVVQQALGLHNAKPCTWQEGFSAEQKLFIAPPVNGWILIVGSGLPDPSEDVDACFRFLVNLSRKLGQVQYFNANRVLGHHAWVRADGGRIARGYAWAGSTVWNQGQKTRAERDLGLNCLDYFETSEEISFGTPEAISSNTEKVHLLAARWSLDPNAIDEHIFQHAFGIVGEPSRIY